MTRNEIEIFFMAWFIKNTHLKNLALMLKWYKGVHLQTPLQPSANKNLFCVLYIPIITVIIIKV